MFTVQIIIHFFDCVVLKEIINDDYGEKRNSKHSNDKLDKLERFQSHQNRKAQKEKDYKKIFTWLLNTRYNENILNFHRL